MKKIELHQINVTVVLRVIDGDKSDGLRQFQTGLLLDTDAEWAALRENIQQEIVRLQQELNNAAGN